MQRTFVRKRISRTNNAAIKIVCENIETLHPISVMMGSGKAYRREFKE
jgi:hypothetical protein